MFAIKRHLPIKLQSERIRRLSKREMVDYACGIDAALFPYFCAAAGELAESMRYVVVTTFRDFLKCGTLHRWKRTSR